MFFICQIGSIWLIMAIMAIMAIHGFTICQ